LVETGHTEWQSIDPCRTAENEKKDRKKSRAVARSREERGEEKPASTGFVGVGKVRVETKRDGPGRGKRRKGLSLRGNRRKIPL